ncbi:ER lumen protein retaining receptor, partial [Opisthorchis viverrini]
MNVFRLAGDLSHLLAIFILLLKIYSSRSCRGRFAQCFNPHTFLRLIREDTTDVRTGLHDEISGPLLYNTIMKIVFILSSYLTVYFMYSKFKQTLETTDSLFRLPYFIVPIGGLAVLVNHNATPLEVCNYTCYLINPYHVAGSKALLFLFPPDQQQVLWTFSIYLESVAILPQLFMISSTGQAETITAHYLFALGSYRAMYLLNWIYRYYTEDVYDLIAIVAGCVQTLLYIDFFYLYVTKGQCLCP